MVDVVTSFSPLPDNLGELHNLQMEDETIGPVFQAVQVYNTHNTLVHVNVIIMDACYFYLVYVIHTLGLQV